MKLLRIVCLLVLTQFSLLGQTIKKSDEKFIKAKAYSASKATDNSILSFYTSDELKLENIVIPANTIFTANIRLAEGRAFMKVSKVKIGNDIYTIDWRVVGPDYNEGIPVSAKSKNIEVYDGEGLIFKVFTN
jgi:hypothetical protein